MGLYLTIDVDFDIAFLLPSTSPRNPIHVPRLRLRVKAQSSASIEARIKCVGSGKEGFVRD